MNCLRCWALGLLLFSTPVADAVFARSEPDAPPQYCTVFHHMVKSGGSTIKDKLFTAFFVEGLPPPATCVNGAGSEHECLNAISNASVIMGFAELLRYPMQAVGRECEYFTMMRHPIDRLVSGFFYCPNDHDVQGRPAEWCGDSDHPTPATERLLGYAKGRWGNKAFRQMLYGIYCPGEAFCEEANPRPPNSVETAGGWTLLAAVQEIIGSYVAVGIMEHWDLSMRLFDVRVTSPVRDWQADLRSNPGTNSARREAVYKWAHASPEIHRVLATDLLVYDYAVSVFKSQTRSSLGTIW